jgi:spore germination protein YaaH
MQKGIINKIKVVCKTCQNDFYVWPSDRKRGRSVYCSKKCLYNRIFTKKDREKLSLINKGRKWKEETREKRMKSLKGINKGARAWNWKAGKVKYRALHSWVQRTLGNPKKCEHCGKVFLKTYQIDWANVDHKYRRNSNDWIRLCRRCHANYDKKLTIAD